MNVKTVGSISRAYKKDQQFVRPRGHRKKKLTDEQVEQLKKWIDDDCQQTLEESYH